MKQATLKANVPLILPWTTASLGFNKLEWRGGAASADRDSFDHVPGPLFLADGEAVSIGRIRPHP